MIDKPSVLITSLGRTGTQFFSLLFKDILPDCDSFHEPDIVQFAGVKNRITPFLSRVRSAGIYNMIILKSIGKWSLVRLSDRRLKNELNDLEASIDLSRQRVKFIQSKKRNVYVESNIGYYGLIDLLPNVFSQHRAIFIVRDGRDWVRSTYNWGEIFGKKGVRAIFSHKWPTAKDLLDSPYAEQWDSLSRFQKICWVWSRLNEYALTTVEKNPHARVFYFENIFSDEQKYTYLKELVDFAIDLPEISTTQISKAEGWLKKKVHMSSKDFPAWDNWTSEQKEQFQQICGPLMEKLGYKFD
jgi:hypothetical protein